MIYLDCAATTVKKPECVKQAVLEAMDSLGNAARGAHECALGAARTVYTAREKIAEMFCCPRPENTVFTANSTEALNIAICGLIGENDHVISTDLEHNSVLRPIYRLCKESGAKADFVTADGDGRIDYADFSRLINGSTRAIVTTHASNLTGDLVDIRTVGEIAHANGLLYIVDASQTAGTFDIDMQRDNIDVLCFTGHKGLMGPQGTGGMCIMPGVEIRPFRVGGTGVMSYSMEQPAQYPVRLEAGTANSHGIAGLLAAVDYIADVTPEAIHAHELSLEQRFYRAVKDIPGVRVYGDHSGDRAPICALNIREYGSSRVADELACEYDIAVRPGAHCAPRLHTALRTADTGAVRFSFGWFNTAEEVDAAARAVERIAEC